MKKYEKNYFFNFNNYFKILNSTKNIDVKIFNLKEDIRLLNEKYELVLLDHNFLSSPKKLNEYQKKYFENDLLPTDIVNIGEIDFINGEILIKKSGEVFEK